MIPITIKMHKWSKWIGPFKLTITAKDVQKFLDGLVLKNDAGEFVQFNVVALD